VEGDTERKVDKQVGEPACGYPESVEFKPYTINDAEGNEYGPFHGHYVIFNLAFEHGVSWSSLKYGANLKRFCQALDGNGKEDKAAWKVHPYLTGEGGRSFEPDEIFTGASSRSLFGSKGKDCKVLSTEKIVENRLDPNVGGNNCLSETLMFTLESSVLSKSSTELQPLIVEHPIRNAEEGYKESLYVLWADLWFMPDGTGMLSFKVVLDETSTVDITRCTRLIRTLRDFKDAETLLDSKSFWAEVVFKEWLGFDEGKHSDLLMTSMLQDQSGTPLSYVDRYSRYCKTLIAVQTPDIHDGNAMAWGRPLADPPVDGDANLSDNVNNELNMTRYQNAVIAGYATVKDMIPFELATVSEEGHSVGWNKDEGWQYSLEYIRKMIEENFIEVWEYWAGLALRDSCVFVSYNKKVPIMCQAEARYYPLYVHTYHLRHKLDMLSDKIVDYGMSDAFRGRRIQDQFQRFRNHFWFQESTKDFVGVEVFDQMKKGMKLPELYESVSSEVTEVAQHLQQKWERSIRTWVLFLGVFTWPIKTAWDTWLFPKVTEYGTAHIGTLQEHWCGILIAALILFSVLWGIHYLFGRFRPSINRFGAKIWSKFNNSFLSE